MGQWWESLSTEIHSGFYVFHYLTFRACLAALTSFLVAFFLGPWMIRFLKNLQWGQSIREDGPKTHYVKAGTPTMGGLLILGSLTIATLLWADLRQGYVPLVLGVTLAFGAIGFLDDWRKIVRKNSKGLSSKEKFFLQSLVALVGVGLLLYYSPESDVDVLYLPFLKSWSFPMGYWYLLFGYLVVVGASNAVNLTDGLDGLAILPTVLVGSGLGVFAYVTGHNTFANYLHIPYIAGSGELIVFCGALAGAGLGFLWYNCYPAQVIMGDVGALALGAALGMISLITHQELVLFVMGGIFVAETLSVIIQVGSFKLRGKRVFKMAPLHHHFELLGWAEPKVVVRFWLTTLILVLLGLATLKIR